MPYGGRPCNPSQRSRILACMQEIKEKQRRPSPVGRPFGLALHDGNLWMGSWENDSVVAVDPATWTVREMHKAPGRPYGIVSWNGELRVVLGFGGDDDDRYFYTLVPGKGFDESSKVPCPDLTGSYAAVDGSTLYLGQMHLKRILALASSGGAGRAIALPARCAGFAAAGSRFYMIAGDEELENLQFGTIDVTQDAPTFAPLASMNDAARTLLYDGTSWWTAYRDENEIVEFSAPG